MRTETLKVLWASLILLLAACFPALDTFYQPSAEGGIVRKHVCRGQIGPPDTIDFARERVHISVTTYMRWKESERPLVEVAVRIPADVSLSFKSKEFIISDQGGSHYLLPDRVDGFNYLPYSEQKLIPVSNWGLLRGGIYDVYYLDFYLPTSEVARFSFLMPAILISGKEANIPPISFSLERGWYMSCPGFSGQIN